MKITVVTPLLRKQNLPALEENIAEVLAAHDWQWMIVVDRLRVENPDTPWPKPARYPKREILRGYDCEPFCGGDQWRSSVARNLASEIKDGWIINLDDDCFLEPMAGKLLSMVCPEMMVITWQTRDDQGVRNYPRPQFSGMADTNAFAYRAEVLEHVQWKVAANADCGFFAELQQEARERGWPIAYFQEIGVNWNANR